MTSSRIETDVRERYQDYLRDESRQTGDASGIAFPESEEAVAELLRSSRGQVTTQGARTGITGGAVPNSGLILNLSRMNRITGINCTGLPTTPYSISVQPGMTLKDLKSELKELEFDTDSWTDESKVALQELEQDPEQYFFPPDPTEDTASIGGMIACNASGARSFKYGPTRSYIRSLRVVLTDGRTLNLQRGADKAIENTFSIQTEAGEISGSLPVYRMPATKNASGYYSVPDMDLVDLFIGAEGTLGVITEAELLLRPAPSAIWAVMTFFKTIQEAEQFVAQCKEKAINAVAAIEFFDSNAIDLLRQQKADNPAFSFLPDLSPDWGPCVYVELDGEDESSVEDACMTLAEIIENHDVPESATWMATEPSELARMKEFRHALPEAVNLTIDTYRKSEPNITKLGTDFAVPSQHLHRMIDRYISDLDQAGLRYVIFGHIGNDHLHVNILPTTMDEYNRGKALYLVWAKLAVELGGTVSAEHGIGKIKIQFLAEMYGVEGIHSMQELKRLLDPEWRLNMGNLFRRPE